MKHTFTLLCLLTTMHTTYAQCTSSVPANAIVITSETAATNSQSGVSFWICDEAFQQIFTGSNNNFYIESGAFFSAINGNENTIRYKGNVQLGVFGSGNTIYATSASAISDQGSGNTIIPCGANGVVFNYDNAPANPCTVVSVDEVVAETVSAFFDPTMDAMVLNDPAGILREVHIYDPSGRSVGQLVETRATTFSMAGLPTGAYIAQLITTTGRSTVRFVK